MCISHLLQVGSCLAQGQGYDEHREEHFQETEGSIAINSDYRATSAQLLNVHVFRLHTFQENKYKSEKSISVTPAHSSFSWGEW